MKVSNFFFEKTFAKKLTTSRIPRPSPIQVLTGLNVAERARSDGMACIQRDMVVSDFNPSLRPFYSFFKAPLKKFCV